MLQNGNVPNRESCGTDRKSFGTDGSNVRCRSEWAFLQPVPNGHFSSLRTANARERMVRKIRSPSEREFLQSVKVKHSRTDNSEPRLRPNGWFRAELLAERDPTPSERMVPNPILFRNGWFRKSGVLRNGHFCRLSSPSPSGRVAPNQGSVRTDGSEPRFPRNGPQVLRNGCFRT